MRRYAEWRPVAVRRWATAWVGFLTGAAIFGASLLVVAPNYAVVMGATLAGRWVTGWLLQRQMAPLRDGAGAGQFAANLRLARETTYAYDEGLLSFEGPWLVYTGRRCTFSVPASAVKVDAVGPTSLTFRFGEADDERAAHLTVAKDEAFLVAAVAWGANTEEEGGLAVLPPISPNETAFGAIRSFAAFFAFAAILFLVGRALLIQHFGRLYWVCLVLGVPGAALYLAASRRALLRIASGEPRRPLIWNPTIFGSKNPPELPKG